MVRRHLSSPLCSLLCSLLVGILPLSVHAADALRPPPSPLPADVAKAKAKELEKMRLIAKLHADAPKLADSAGANPLEAPIFHRYDRP